MKKISQNTQFAIPPVKMNKSLEDLLNLHRFHLSVMPVASETLQLGIPLTSGNKTLPIM
jgi:hypothetical protein